MDLHAKVAAWLLPIAFFGGALALILTGTVPVDSKGGLAAYLVTYPTVVIEVGGYIILGAAALWVAQTIRNMSWFDRYSAAREMLKVHERVGTDEELPGDAEACARQNAGNSIFYGLIMLGLLVGFMV